MLKKVYRCLKPDGVYLECDYIATSQVIEEMAFAECKRRRGRDSIPDGAFVHFDTPLTLEHERQAIRAGAFNRLMSSGFCR